MKVSLSINEDRIRKYYIFAVETKIKLILFRCLSKPENTKIIFVLNSVNFDKLEFYYGLVIQLIYRNGF